MVIALHLLQRVAQEVESRSSSCPGAGKSFTLPLGQRLLDVTSAPGTPPGEAAAPSAPSRLHIVDLEAGTASAAPQLPATCRASAGLLQE